MAAIGRRKLTPVKGKRGVFIYTNSIGEKFNIGSRNIGKHEEYVYDKYTDMFTECYYYELDYSENARINTLSARSMATYFLKGLNYIDHIGLEPDYTDVAKTPAGALLVLNKYYEKYGYPREKYDE